MGQIRAIVQQLVRRCGTDNPFEIAGRKSIAIQFSRLKDILGYHHTYKRVSTICLHCELSEPEQRFVCAHELGHAVLHPAVNTPFLRRSTLFSVGKIEREANEFAVELLIPDDVLSKYNPCDTLTEREVAAIYGVPYELVRLKRENLQCW